VRDPFPNHHGIDASAAPGPAPRWAAELASRIRAGFLRTVISTSALTGIFFIAYFFVQRHPAYPPMQMPLTALDLLIPFQPAALLAYVSLWIYVGVGPGLQRSFRDFAVCGLWLCALCVGGLAIFYFLPTQVPPPVLSATRFPGFDMLRRVDQTSNACPSMHVAVAIFTAVRVEASLRSMRVPFTVRCLNFIWCLVIAYSTLAIKQHVVLDVAAGALLGLSFAAMSLRWRPGSEREPGFAALQVPPVH
jgi:membrane-associated phospholipid phosphatase